jgi:hypothetical protein
MKISGMIKVSIFALNYDTSANSAIEVSLVQQIVLVKFISIKKIYCLGPHVFSTLSTIELPGACAIKLFGHN